VDAWVAVSDEIVEGLKGDGMEPSRIHRIPNGVDTARFRPLASEVRAGIRRRLGWPPDAQVAAFSGRLVASKGLMPFLEAWRSASRPAGALLALLGDGPERGALEAVAGMDPSVRILGSRDDVEKVLGAADLFVFPSRREGMPNAVLEAMACGLPVAAFRIGGVEDLVTDGVEGVLRAEGDDAGLARAALDLLADPGLLAALGQAARRRAEGFDRRRVARELLAIYEGKVP
jgi:glycosyltransferase involved in cell wall biosynthesis